MRLIIVRDSHGKDKEMRISRFVNPSKSAPPGHDIVFIELYWYEKLYRNITGKALFNLRLFKE